MGWQHPYHRDSKQFAQHRQRFAGRRGDSHPRTLSGWARAVTPLTVALPLAAFTAVFLWDGPPPGFAEAVGGGTYSSSESAGGSITATFHRCSGSQRYTCVVDGDTIWLQGEKIRLADIDTPEISKPRCAREAQLGERATVRLTTLLNEGAFALVRDPFGANEDRYGRKLRVVQRGGDSLGERLVNEGLALRWGGGKPDWC